MKVIKIGGCNGSGKSSLVRELLALASVGAEPKLHYGKGIKVDAYKVPPTQQPRKYIRPPLIVLGDYSSPCGGMDTISDKFKRLELLERYAIEDNIVVFEGLITGKTYGAIGDISERATHKGHWLYCFMDTPFDTCVERVLKRRAQKRNFNAFDPDRTMRSTYKAVQSVAKRAAAEGHSVYWINHKSTPQQAAANLLQIIDNFVKTGDIYADR